MPPSRVVAAFEVSVLSFGKLSLNSTNQGWKNTK